MPFLVVGGVTVNVQAPGGVRHDIEEGIDRQRAFDKTMRTAVISATPRKNRWQISTTLATRAASDVLIAALNAPPPVVCSGDLLNATVNCHSQYLGMQPEPTSNGVTKYRVSFTLHEQ
jgi:hypothetical protein